MFDHELSINDILESNVFIGRLSGLRSECSQPGTFASVECLMDLDDVNNESESEGSIAESLDVELDM